MDKGWKVALAFIGIFTAGGITGALLALRVVTVQSPPATSIETPPPVTVSPTQPPPQTPPPVTSPTTEPTTPVVSTGPTPQPQGNSPTTETGISAAPTSTPVQPPAIGPQLFRRLTNQLTLAQGQRARIRAVEARATDELNRLRRDSLHSTQVLIDKTEDEIRAILTPDQVVKFDVSVAHQRDLVQKWMEQQKRAREKLMPGRGGNMIASPTQTSGTEPKKE
jgi:hypothetical protein